MTRQIANSEERQGEEKVAVIYLRVSTKEQAEKDGDPEGYSIPAQRDACRRRALSLGANVIAEFADKGESAKTSDRPALQAMLDRVAKGDIDFVIVHKVDRLARNRADDVQITLALKTAGVQLVSVTENIDETPSGRLLHGIMASIAEFYSQNLATEIMKGTLQKAKGGGTPSMAPIGYLNVHKLVDATPVRTVELDPKRAPLITWAFETYATGEWSLRKLADDLERRGFTQRAGRRRVERPFPANRLHGLLQNRYYLGIVTYQGIEYEGKHPPLVKPEVFEQVQAVLESHRQGGERAYRHTHYLKGTLRCGRCHSRLAYSFSRGNGGTYAYYFCLGRHQGRTACDLPHLDPDAVEVAVERYWEGELLGAEVTKELREALLEDVRTLDSRSDRERRSLTTELLRLRQERYRWAEKAMTGAVPDDIAQEKQASLSKQIGHAQARLAALQIAATDIQLMVEACLDLAERCAVAYRLASPQGRREWNQAWWNRLEIDVESDAAPNPVVRRGERTPLLEAIMTAETAKPQVRGTKARTRTQEARVFSRCDGSTVATLVRARGLEPPPLSGPGPKPGASASFATPATAGAQA